MVVLDPPGEGQGGGAFRRGDWRRDQGRGEGGHLREGMGGGGGEEGVCRVRGC